jgi:hypothetical protein
MPDGEDDDERIFEPIKDDIAAGAEWDQPFPEFGVHVLHKASGARLPFESFHASAYGFHSPTRGRGIVFSKEAKKPLNVRQRRGRPDQS